MPALPSKALDTFPNPEPGRDYIIEIETPEFTCLCPKTGQPDFATLAIEYVPDRLCVELKSLKLYIWSYRNEGHFHEQVTNAILGDLVTALQPRWLQVRAAFYVRGGIYTTVTVEHRQPGWAPPPPPPANLPRERQSARDAALPDSGGGAAEATGLPGRRPSARADRPPARARAGTERTTGASGAEPPAPTRDVCLGVDLGTSACRVMALDRQGKVLALAEMPLAAATRARPEQLTQEPRDWWKAVLAGLKAAVAQVDARRVQRIGVAATPGTLLLCSDRGEPLTPGILHDDRRAQAEAERIAALAPESAAAQARSSLAKLLWLQRSKLLAGASLALHPADWIGGRLSGIYGRSDQHNALALGYDPVAGAWPAWLRALGVPQSLLPEIDEPGTRLGTLNPDVAAGLGLAPEVEVVAGTTDDVAAFLAAGAAEPGHGVTALGSVLVLKLLAQAPLVSAAHGVYSQRLGRFWLAGGASNSGGHVLLRYFSLEQMREMTAVLDPDQPTGLDYYPLTNVGERFPVADPRLEPQLEPLPGDTVQLFQGMLEGIARIEAQGYAVLAELGGPAVTTVWTTGGGSLNPAWTRIRARTLGVPLKAARSQQAAYGAALLAAGVVQQTFA